MAVFGQMVRDEGLCGVGGCGSFGLAASAMKLISVGVGEASENDSPKGWV